MIAAGGEVGRVAKLRSVEKGRWYRESGRESSGRIERNRGERIGRETQFEFVEPARRRLATRVAEFTLLAERR